MIRRGLALMIVASVILSGCGGGGGNKGESTTTTSSGPPVTGLSKVNYTFPPRLVTNQADLSSSISVALTAKDLPSGWVTTHPPSTFTPRPEIMDEVLVQCIFGEQPSPLTSYVVSALYVSPDFRSFAQSFTRSVSTKSAAQSDFKSFTRDRISKCQDAMYDREHNPPKDVNPVDIFHKKFGNAVPVTMPVDTIPPPDGSTDILGFKMVVAPTDRQPLYQDIYAYGAGRFETVLIMFGPAPQDPNVEANVIKALKSRTIAAALKG